MRRKLLSKVGEQGGIMIAFLALSIQLLMCGAMYVSPTLHKRT